MRTRFDQQLEKLHVELIKMGSLCEQAITLASSSLEVQEENNLHKVAALESEVDAKEREIEDICMRLLLQHLKWLQTLKESATRRQIFLT